MHTFMTQQTMCENVIEFSDAGFDGWTQPPKWGENDQKPAQIQMSPKMQNDAK